MRSSWDQKRVDEEMAALLQVPEHDRTPEQRERMWELDHILPARNCDTMVIRGQHGTGLYNDGDYCWQPQYMGDGTAAVVSPTCMVPKPGPDGIRDYMNGHETAPFCATEQEAIDWLRERKLYGQVMRYKHYGTPEERANEFRFHPTGRSPSGYWRRYTPTCTAGVACIVNPPERDRMHVSPMTALRGVKVVDTDGSERTVGLPD